jgi:SAM-dependent methyltransferase
MQPDPTTRFSSRVGAYERFRPSYPKELIELARRECGLAPPSRIADIGCGTGLLARAILETGCEVVGVEPNADMRAAGERGLAGYPNFHSVDGRAEATGLADASIDLVTAGQAFHWFEPAAARAEFDRILKPPCRVLLVWNERRMEPGFMKEYETAIAHYAPEQKRVNVERIADFFGAGEFREAVLPNEQRLDAEGLRGRLASSSYAPEAGTPEFQKLMDAMDALFARHERGGVVTVLYETQVYFGTLRRPS